jgi:hypothetical protein
MGREYTQRDYFLYPLYYERVLKILEEELEMVEKSGKKTLWYYSAVETLKQLKKEKGVNLSPYDMNNIVYALLRRIKE